MTEPYQQQWPSPPTQWSAPAYPPPARLPDFPHPEPRPYHLMLRTWNYAVWRPIVGIVVLFVCFFVVAPLVLLPVLAIGVAVGGGPFWQKFQSAATFQTVDPSALLYLNLVLGSMIFVTWFIIRVFHRMRPRWLMSVMPGIRWRFFFACLGIAVVALVAQVLVGHLLPADAQSDTGGKLNHFTASSLAVGLIVLFTTPFQAAGEEYVFRGYLMQAIGALFRFKWVAIIVTATIFALMHGVQNFPLFFDRFMFGLIAGWAVTITGGLEAGIALHILNNFLAFGVAVAFGDLTQTLTVSQVSWWNIVLTLTQSGVYLGLVVLLARKMNVQTMTRPPVQ
ncbi:MAG: lysostaphin resistance A-like protein [Nocardioidaceae bacterium]